jgi:hypothetical protein
LLARYSERIKFRVNQVWGTNKAVAFVYRNISVTSPPMATRFKIGG